LTAAALALKSLLHPRAVQGQESMRILITGGCGFIGSAVIRHLLRATAHHVVNIDKLTYAANLANLDEVLPNSRYAFEKADIGDAGALAAIFDRYNPDAVMHLAAETHVDRSIGSPQPFIDSNIVGTFTLLEAARRHYDGLDEARKERFRFHHVSTDEVFGSADPGGYFTEETAHAPNSPYSASKASADMLARAWNRTYHLPVVTSNCSNNYGPYQFPEKFIPTVILAAVEGRPIPVYGDGQNVRDWLFVEDHAEALLLILEHGAVGQTYNVGGSGDTKNLAMARMICQVVDDLFPGSPHRPHAKLITFVPDRPGHDLRYAIDASKLKHDLGWQPQTPLDEGLRRTVAWYLENRAWWAEIRRRERT
jgi:dTDP-glucose 4,6-dehydratase